MKKILAVLSALILSFSAFAFVGCVDESKNSESGAPNSEIEENSEQDRLEFPL